MADAIATNRGDSDSARSASHGAGSIKIDVCVCVFVCVCVCVCVCGSTVCSFFLPLWATLGSFRVLRASDEAGSKARR